MAADEGKRELKGAKAASGSVQRASFENLYAVQILYLSQIFDTRLKISNLKLSANGNAGGTLMLH